MKEALRLSDELVDEFLAADIYVMGVPMYNWSVTSGFKAYIDNIVRINRTWAYIPDENPEFPDKPLVHSKKMFVIASRGDGGFAPGERNHKRDFQIPLIKEVFGMLGVTDITFITVENDEYGGQKLADSLATARSQIAELTNGPCRLRRGCLLNRIQEFISSPSEARVRVAWGLFRRGFQGLETDISRGSGDPTRRVLLNSSHSPLRLCRTWRSNL